MTRFVSALVFTSLLWGFLITGTQFSAHAKLSGDRTEAEATLSVDSLLLDQYPEARAAYSLRLLRSGYSGPVLRVRRSSDDAEQDIGFANDGWIDTTAISDFVGSGDGFVVKWYAQVEGSPDLVQSTNSKQPRIAQGGSVETDEKGHPAIYVQPDDYMGAGAFDVALKQHDYTMMGVLQPAQSGNNEKTIFGIGNLSYKPWESVAYRYTQSYVNNDDVRMGSGSGLPFGTRGLITQRNTGSEADLWWGHTKYATSTDNALSNQVERNQVSLGGDGNNGYEGYIGELVYFPALSDADLLGVYNNITLDWEVGPVEWNKQALLPQSESWQVPLYDWLETISISDVELDFSGTLQYDNSYSDQDELADIWLKTRELTASSVTRHEPKWYVLDDGNGHGIEGAGKVRANHNPRGSGDYPGNPPRSWQNEPAYWYQLDIPLSGGGQGNPWYQDPAMGRRAMIVSTVDLMMHGGTYNKSSDAYDMKGKAFLGMAEAYRWAGDVMPADVQAAYESGMERIVDDLMERGPKGANTNMGMFVINGCANLYRATDDSGLKQKCVELVKRSLFGYKDGELETKHKVFPYNLPGSSGNDGGAFDPSGFIMEGNQSEIFYNGESIYHIMGALSVVTDRDTGTILSDWTFLEEVVERLSEYRSYQIFYDPGRDPDGQPPDDLHIFTAGSGFAGRTSAGAPSGQSAEPWKFFGVADKFPDEGWQIGHWPNGERLPSVSKMENEISSMLSDMDSEMSSYYTGDPPTQWSGWSPWTRKSAYLPEKGWYSRMETKKNNNDPQYKKIPAERDGTTWNKTFGGSAETPSGDVLGEQYWSYKGTDANGKAFGFFIEAQALQGDSYGGWYGGKIETFWIEDAGVLLITRHGKGGCDRSSPDDYNGYEDSKCWMNLDEKAANHVWGRDENDKGFTTLRLLGEDINRTTTFDTGGSPPSVTINNVFNDPNLTDRGDGEEGSAVLEGSVEVENKFAVQTSGLKVTHTVTSDQTDDVNELWASIPVYLRHNSPHTPGKGAQIDMSDTRIEYWDGSSWVEVPFDTDGDGVPEIVTTGALRLGRDYNDGEGFKYGYVNFASDQDIRRAKHKYYDPYQTETGVRTIHIDLHGNPGTTKTMPADKSVSYTIQTMDPTSEGGTSTSQVIPLQEGWNIVSSFISPTAPAMDSVFAGMQSEITVVENEVGERYRPAEDINEIGQWNSEEAYLVHTTSDTDLSIEGDSLGSPSISLEEGWNWIPYFPSSPLPVNEAVSSITEDLVLVKDETGRVYLQEKDPDVLEQMEPGEGYKIYVRNSTTLTYPDGSN